MTRLEELLAGPRTPETDSEIGQIVKDNAHTMLGIVLFAKTLDRIRLQGELRTGLSFHETFENLSEMLKKLEGM